MFNPNSAGQFIAVVDKDPSYTDTQKTCLIALAAELLRKGDPVSFTHRGNQTTALLYRYEFPFLGSAGTPVLKPGWVSGLAQGSVLVGLATAAQRTGNPQYLTAAQKTFNSFFLPVNRDGFVTREYGMTYFQEYPTRPWSYVLNGHNEALIALHLW